MKPSEYPPEYYSFEKYNTKQRMLTYWHQINEVLKRQPSSVLEIGVGTGLVSSYLRHLGIEVKTFDINAALKPDYIGSVLDIDAIVDRQFDLVLCARVLHHLPFSQLPIALEKIAKVSRRDAVVTLPMEDFRLYFMFRYTSSSIKTFSIPIPLAIKKLVFRLMKLNQSSKFRSGQWKINDFSGITHKSIQDAVSQHWNILRQYPIPEDSAHFLMVIQKR